MELKTRYQYTYFIYPYIIEQKNISKYFLRLLKDKNCNLRLFEGQKDFDIYSYFLPKIREYMFWSFDLDKEKRKAFLEEDNKLKALILSKKPCTIFEYFLGKDIQGKVGEKNGIFFNIQKIELICFNTGVCFLVFKTNIENSNQMADVLNFNYKFRDINSEFSMLKEFENINIGTDKFKDVQELKNLIKQITGPNSSAKALNLDTNRFLTYSYACIDSNYWNEQNDIEKIEHEFFKYSNVLPENYNSNIDRKTVSNNFNILSKNKYARCGFTKVGTGLLASSADSTNYTTLPYAYENEYFYTYIFNLYKKIYLRKINSELKNKNNNATKKFVEFTQEVWIQEITNDTDGNLMNNQWENVLELEKNYREIKTKYDLMYKELNISKNSKINKMIFIILVAIIIFNIINLFK